LLCLVDWLKRKTDSFFQWVDLAQATTTSGGRKGRY